MNETIEKDRVEKLMEINELLGKTKEQRRICTLLMDIAQDETQPQVLRSAMLLAINTILESEK